MTNFQGLKLISRFCCFDISGQMYFANASCLYSQWFGWPSTLPPCVIPDENVAAGAASPDVTLSHVARRLKDARKPRRDGAIIKGAWRSHGADRHVCGVCGGPQGINAAQRPRLLLLINANGAHFAVKLTKQTQPATVGNLLQAQLKSTPQRSFQKWLLSPKRVVIPKKRGRAVVVGGGNGRRAGRSQHG